MGRPTINDVARLAGVSKGTVSLSYSGARPVAEETKRRIRAAADELQWSPSRSARALATSRAGTVGLVLARPPEVLTMDDFFPRFLSGCERAFAEAGVGVMLNLATDAAMEEAIYRSFADGRVDGVILLDVTEPDPRLSLVEELGLPAVALLPYVRGPGRTPSVPSVHTDDATAIQDLVRGLVARGHERIAHVAGPPHFTHARVRRRAFISTMEELSLTADLVVEGDFTPASGREATVTLLERSDRPTAIVYANDAMAHAGMSRAQSLGLDVPGDLSITGFGDEELSAHLSPPLTTVEVGADVSGEAVARLLLDTIDGRAVTHQQLDCVHTVDRLSVAPPRTERPAVPDEAEALARGAEGDAAM